MPPPPLAVGPFLDAGSGEAADAAPARRVLSMTIDLRISAQPRAYL
jgi:hypothetical protein